MANLKHVGRLVSNRRKVAVAYRVLPGDSEHCLIVDTANLSDDDHDSLIALIESDAGQRESDLAVAMQRARLRDGSIMLAAFHTRGKFTRVRTDQVELTPNTTTSALLSEVNAAIAEQQGVTVEDLAIQAGANETEVQTIATAQELPTSEVLAESQAANVGDAGVLTDEDLAAQYRSQADAMFKEAKRLREQAEELAPTKKKKTTTKA